MFKELNILDKTLNSIYSFGSPYNGHYGHLVLLPNGEIAGHFNQNEKKWLMNKKNSVFILL